jgi:GH24 family phage-related lysozyme (muramidase)
MICETSLNIIKFFSTIDDSSMVEIGLHHKLNMQNIWTVGYDHQIIYNGRLLKGSKDKYLAYLQFDGLSMFDAEILLEKDIHNLERIISNLITVPLSKNKFSAILSFAHNLGIDAFKNTQMVNLINNSNFNAAFGEFKKYDTKNGKILKTLISRRYQEADLFYS